MTRHTLAQRLHANRNRSIGHPPFDIDALPVCQREAWLRKADERLPAPRRVIFDFLTEYFSRPQRGGGGAPAPSSLNDAPPTNCSERQAPIDLDAAREAGLSPCSVSQPVSLNNHERGNSRRKA